MVIRIQYAIFAIIKRPIQSSYSKCKSKYRPKIKINGNNIIHIMSKLIVDQKTIQDLFSAKKADFLIPDYQRPYAWGEEECRTLWNDIFEFAFPNNNCDEFDSDSDEYFLGPIVTFKNDKGQLEVIDGQQRLTTLMLLLRAFYDKFLNMQDQNSKDTRENIAKCLWKTNEFGRPKTDELKIDSEVATDNDKDEFLHILRTGQVNKEQTSKYAQNYRFFLGEISEFLSSYPSYFAFLPTRILNNCILLPIEAETQDTALRIFSTLNDRGLPLSDSDIFKAQFYKYYSSIGKKDWFINTWKDLEAVCDEVFSPISGTPMDELFTRYMYYVRAKQGNKNSTTEALRKFYEKDGYALMKEEVTLKDVQDLALFWKAVADQNADRFSERILRRLFVLHYAPNSMWTYFVSVYYLEKRNKEGLLDDASFFAFLNKITAFIWAYSIFKPGVNSLRTPVYAEMVNLVQGKNVTFQDFKFDEENIRSMFNNYAFYNGRPITKAMLAWWAFNNDSQSLITPLEMPFDIEHIFARNRIQHDSLENPRSIELLGNKSLLERRINIRASDYKFDDKKKYYKGFTNARNVQKEGTKIIELVNLADSHNDFTEKNIIERNSDIINGFISYLKDNQLI